MSFVATKGKIGFGTVFSYSTNIVTPSYTAVAEVIGITPPKIKVGKVDASRFDSNTLANGLPIEDNLPGWVDPGEWTFKLVYDSAAAVAAVIYGLIGTEILGKVIKPDTKGYTFQGYISDYGEEIPMKDRMTLDITVRINGGSVMATV